MEVINDKVLHGLYLVLDPSQKPTLLFERLQLALDAGINLVQVWDHWPTSTSKAQKLSFLERVLHCCQPYQVPVLVNNQWKLLKEVPLAGIHFDTLPADLDTIRAQLDNPIIVGLTAGNCLPLIQSGLAAGVDYLSFCAMFSSPSAVGCELINPQVVQETGRLASVPIFVSGGISPENLPQLAALPISGIALISGIMNSPQPASRIAAYRQALSTYLNP